MDPFRSAMLLNNTLIEGMGGEATLTIFFTVLSLHSSEEGFPRIPIALTPKVLSLSLRLVFYRRFLRPTLPLSIVTWPNFTFWTTGPEKLEFTLTVRMLGTPLTVRTKPFAKRPCRKLRLIILIVSVDPPVRCRRHDLAIMILGKSKSPTELDPRVRVGKIIASFNMFETTLTCTNHNSPHNAQNEREDRP